jgi:integrase
MRGGVYYYERRVPQAVMIDEASWERHFDRQKLYRKSLHTKVHAEVLRPADEARQDFERRVRSALTGAVAVHPPAVAAPVIPVVPARQITPDLLAAIAEQQRSQLVRRWAAAVVAAEREEQGAEELERLRYNREMDAVHTKDLLTRPGARTSSPWPETPVEIAEELVKRLGLDAVDGSMAFASVVMAVRQGAVAGEEEVDKLLDGRLPAASLAPVPPPAAPGATLRDAVERYLSDKNVRPKTASDTRKSLVLFEQVIGRKDLSELSRSHFKQFASALGQKQVGGRSVGSVERGISPATVKKRVAFLRSAINHAINVDLYEGGNPAAGVNVDALVKAADKSKMPAKRPFNLTELNLIFSYPWFAGSNGVRDRDTHRPGLVRLSDARYWAPVVALFTGCRASELGGLKLNEVELDGPFPHIHIRDNEYRPTKKGYARFVPLLDALLDLGFAAYIEEMRRSGHDRVFDDWKSPKNTGDFDKDDAAWSNGSIIRSFNTTVIKNTLGDRMTPGARREVTFHSFRGSFKSMLGLSRHSVPSNVINEVVGHSKGEIDGRYVGTIPLEETYPAIRGCGWPDLRIPRLPDEAFASTVAQAA